MVDNLQIPKDVTKLFEMKDTSGPLKKFLTDLLNKVNTLEKRIKELEDAA